jgi:hypothetical protein
MIVLDVGSGLTKGIFDNERWVIPSVVGVDVSHEVFLAGRPDFEMIKYQSKLYFVGDTAIGNSTNRENTTSAGWAKNKGNLIIHLAAIARAYPNGYVGNIQVVTGLPMAAYKTGDHKAEKEKQLIGNHKFSTKNSDYDVNIDNKSILVFPQALGLHLSLQSRETRIDWSETIAGYVDVGTFSIGFCQIEFKNLSSVKSHGVNCGMSHLAKALKPKLKEKFNFETNEESHLLKSLRNGELNMFNHNGQRVSIDLHEEARDLAAITFKEAIDWFKSNWNYKAMHVFVSGGGGEYIFEQVKKVIPQAELMHKKSVKQTKRKLTVSELEPALFDVVNGYKILAEMHGFGKTHDDQKAT